MNVNPWPDNPMGHPAMDPKYRFQWTFPIIVSKHNSNVVYAGSNVVHKTTNGGKSWTVISPDLTYHDPATLGNSGGPITKDQTSVEYYATIFIIEESPLTANTIWTGSDDGKVFVTRDGGAKWTDVTPPGHGEVHPRLEHRRVAASASASRTSPPIAFSSTTNSPYLWKTTDCGAHWTRIDNGIPSSEFARVLREDPDKRGLLVAGTERGVWFSPDDGAHWQTLRLNLPIVPVHDLVFKQGDLVVATHGRGFYVMDDVSTLEQMSDAIAASSGAPLQAARSVSRLASGGGFGGVGRRRRNAGAITPENAPGPSDRRRIRRRGVTVQYWLKSGGEDVGLDFLDAAGKVIRSYISKPDSAAARRAARRRRLLRSRRRRRASRIEQGVNTFLWNMRYPDAASFPGMILWAANVTGPLVPPGPYKVRMTIARPAGRQRIVQDHSRSAHQSNARRLAGAVTPGNAGTRSFSDANEAVKDIRRIKTELADRQTKKAWPPPVLPDPMVVDATTVTIPPRR